jgi:FHS family glucose/mannose:H+ symporter-like MFS transporter
MAGPAPLQLKPYPGGALALDVVQARRCFPAFLICGILVSFLGAILPAWGYHLKEDFGEVGEYFLSLNLGFLLSAAVSQWLLARKGLKFTLILSNVLASGGFLFLAFYSPPMAATWRLGGVFWLGASAGLLNACMFQAISSLYERDRATTVNLASVLFGLGCLLTALLVAGTYYVYSVPGILMLLATLPGLYACFCAKKTIMSQSPVAPVPFSQVLRKLNDPSAVLFSMLLFFQFGNEWSIAGWLSLFLIRRLGISPQESLLLLALYWAALLVGRMVSQLMLRRMSHTLMLIASIVSSLLGAVVLASTNNRFGAFMGTLFVGAGFASIYPVVLEKMAHRFPAYHAGLYNGIFSLAVTGGLLAPWLLGYVAEAWGIGAVMIAPMIGICVVFLLVLMILLEAKLSGLAVRN